MPLLSPIIPVWNIFSLLKFLNKNQYFITLPYNLRLQPCRYLCAKIDLKLCKIFWFSIILSSHYYIHLTLPFEDKTCLQIAIEGGTIHNMGHHLSHTSYVWIFITYITSIKLADFFFLLLLQISRILQAILFYSFDNQRLNFRLSFAKHNRQ